MRKKLQKQSFVDILRNRCSQKFRKFYRKTTVLKPLFNKVADLKTCKSIKKRLQNRCHEKETTEAVVRRYSSKKAKKINSRQLKKLKTTSAGVDFHYMFRKEPLSFIENKLLCSFLAFSDFSRMKPALVCFYYKLLM